MFYEKQAKQKNPSYNDFPGLDASQNCFIWRPGFEFRKATVYNVLACDYRQPVA
jgi:hypothetical protein